MELQNKVVVITGGSKGLGKALAEAFVAEGAKLVLGARDKSELEKTAKNLKALSVVMDVKKEEEVKKLAELALESYGRIDIWVNNAGIRLPRKSIEETDWVKAHDLLEVNLFGVIYGSKAAIIEMKQKKSGVILNVLSTIALKGEANASAYCASKYAAAGFTKCLRMAAEPNNIKVIAVYPGGMKTEFFGEERPENYAEYMAPSYVADKIVQNLKQEKPEEELVIKRPNK